MEKKRKNKEVFIIIVCLGIVLCFLTIYKLNKRYEDRLYNVLYKNIIYKAKRCSLKNDCSDEFLLKNLYDKNYLDILYDPISKEELNENLKITVSKKNITISDNNKVLYESK